MNTLYLIVLLFKLLPKIKTWKEKREMTRYHTPYVKKNLYSRLSLALNFLSKPKLKINKQLHGAPQPVKG